MRRRPHASHGHRPRTHGVLVDGRVKALKAAFRLRQQEELAAAKQSSWQGFQKRQRTS